MFKYRTDYLRKKIMEQKIAHLQMIQAIITRLGQNSFLVKGWSVGLISALFALSASNTKIFFILLAYLPAIAFWFLDSYFLHQERLFRKLYDHVRNLDNKDIDFSMNTQIGERNTQIVESHVASLIKVAFSKTLLLFHGTLCFSIFFVMQILSIFAKS